RPILRALTDDATVGIYQANYRLGIFMMLIVSMYDYAWRPFYFSTAKEANAKGIFARVLTYLVLFMSAIFLMLTFFIGDIAKISIFGRHIIGPSYWSGLNIIPIVLLGYVFLGISTNLSAGIFIEKKTKYSPFVTGVGAVVNVAANFLLIPPFGMLGAAWATFIAYFIMAVTMYFVVQRIYPVSYEFSRLLKVAGSVAIVIALYYFISIEKLSDSVTIVFLWKTFLIVLFLLLMYMMKFFKAGEISAIKRLWNRRGVKGVSDISDGV
ncbi:MAG: polysaccharide biosynthesis C-terminal domain-containing protein, partial [Ignavibacteriales bacterium]|nr:polysaccharide biosynthesis C-terminal domain-containing protein [Ignavibacteriales bacterium]